MTVEPGESIQEAINKASEGQTVYIKRGEHIINSSIIVNKTITLSGEHAEETIIDGLGEATSILNILANEVKIQNLTIRNSHINGYGIHIKDVTNVKVQDCHIKNCAQGIVFTNSTNCEINKNFITDSNIYGMYLIQRARYNIIFWNTFENNSHAVSINLDCTNNMFYQNNFIQNNIQISGLGVSANLWNTTYPTGGNYWSDYTSADIKSGPYQNETGSDGIRDNPYEPYPDAIDHYPIMGPIRVFHAYKWETKDYYVLVSSNVSKASNLNFECSNEALITFELTGNPEKGFCRVAIPNQLLWVESDTWSVFINSEETEYASISGENYTYICFTHNYLNTKTVKIQGTHCIPEFSSPIILIITLALVTITVVVILKLPKQTPHYFIEVISRKLKSYETTKRLV